MFGMSSSWLVVTLIGGVIGSVVLILLRRITRLRREQAALKQAHPEEPWFWKKAWAKGRIHTSATGLLFCIFFTTVWSVLCIPALSTFFFSGEYSKATNAHATLWHWVIGIFPLINIGLIIWTGFSVIRWYKYGRSVLEIASVPGVIGGQFAGVVRTSVKVKMEDVFRIKLRCIHGTVKGSGDSRRIHRDTIWEDEQLIAHDLLQHDGSQSAIPFLFQIPYECRQTDQHKVDDFILWKLEMDAKTSGVDYRSEFEVPIFKTSQSDPDFMVDESLIARYVAPEDPQRDLRDAGVKRTTSPNGDGNRFIFPMARQFGSASMMTLLAIVFFGVPIFFFYQDFQWFAVPFILIFSLIGLLMTFIALDLWFYRSIVDVSPDGLAVKGGLLGRGPRRWIEFSEIDEIKLDCNMKSEQQKHYDIVVICQGGKKITIAKRLPGQRLANAVLLQIEQVLL